MKAFLFALLLVSQFSFSVCDARETATESNLLQELAAIKQNQPDTSSHLNGIVKKHFPLGESVAQAQSTLNGLGFETRYERAASQSSSPYLLATRKQNEEAGQKADVTVVLYYQSGAVIDGKGFISR